MVPRTGRRFTLLSSVLGLLVSQSASAYVHTVTQSGSGVHWNNPHLNLAGNPTNQVGLDPQSFYQAVVRGLQRWNAASGGAVSFDYWQGTDPSIYPPNSQLNGNNTIYFASNANAATGLSPNILGLTQVWYKPDTGEIMETNVVLNDVDFQFTTNPTDTSGYGSPAAGLGGARSRVFVENVITHELGHAYGLGHSAGLQSTMLYMESPEQAHLGCDEQVGIHSVYATSDAGGRGAVSGVVKGDSGSPVFGAHVLAISRRRGTVLATGLTDSSGQYNISALEPGAYFMMVEPYYAGSAALPSFYASSDSNICNGRHFSRSIATDSSGLIPQVIEVGAGATANADLLAHCGSTSGASFAFSNESLSSSGAPVVYDGTSADVSGFGVADQLAGAGSKFYKLSHLQGHLELHVLAYSLYSPIHPTVKLVDSNGQVVSEGSADSYEGSSGYVNYDTQITADQLSGDYYLDVQGSPLASYLFPAGPVSIDSNPFLLVTGSVNEAAPSLASSLNAGARCQMAENFASYTSPPGNPPKLDVSASGGSSVGFCGTVQKVNQGSAGGPDPGSPSAGAIFGWMLPWIFMGLSAKLQLLRARKRAVTLEA